MFGFPWLVMRLPRSRWSPSLLHISYYDGRGVLRDILVACTEARFSVSRLGVRKEASGNDERDGDGDAVPENERRWRDRVVSVELEVQGARGVAQLILTLSDLKGVISVTTAESAATEA